ncbi:hypothetical protein B0O80DRAFT_475695 [Mortierella sp. GBAus27b]|nr:hypothetical protein B0O80DRAFT_475695 [Mortierella sp. GBAus27b]
MDLNLAATLRGSRSIGDTTMAYASSPGPAVAFSGNEPSTRASLGRGPSSGRMPKRLAVTGSQSALDAPLQDAVVTSMQDCSQEILGGARRGGIPTIVTTLTKDQDGALAISRSSSMPRLADGSLIHNIGASTITQSAAAASAPSVPTTPTPAKLSDTNHHIDYLNKGNNNGTRTISSPSGTSIFPDSNGVVLSRSTTNPDNVEHISHPLDISQMAQRTQTITFDSVQTEQRRRWSRYLPFNKATDSRLAVFLMGCMIIPFLLCLGMQFVKPSPVQINPTSYKCGEGPVFYPIYAVMLGFLVIGCPILSWKLWWIKDGFGIRNELLITMIIGLPGFILYFISPFYLKKLDAGHWNHVNWLILTIFLSHFNSVVLPLIQFFMRQRPKKLASSIKEGHGNRLVSIFRWDSPKKCSGAATMDMCSDTSSFRYHSRSSSHVVSPHHHDNEACDASIYDGRSIAQRSIRSQSPVGEDRLSTVAHYNSASGQKLRGMKGFWAKYGKDVDGNIIPLSQLNPRAFEYTLQDAEMMSELVKFSITVFSAENTKFLQEYDGLRKQVREYYKLVGYGQKQGRTNVSNLTESGVGSAAGPEGAMHGSDVSARAKRKVSTVLGGLASSLNGRRSTQGSIAGKSDDRASQNGSIIGSIMEMEEPIHSQQQTFSIQPTRSYGKPRQEKGNLWKLSLQSSFRTSNPAFVASYGPLQEEDDVNEPMDGSQVQSAPLPLSPSKTPTQTSSHGGRTARHNEAVEDGAGGNESDRSSFSWYGRGNTGSSLSYHDVTSSQFSSSSHDTTSDGIHCTAELFDSYAMDEFHQDGDIGEVTIHDPLQETQSGNSHGYDESYPTTPAAVLLEKSAVSAALDGTSTPCQGTPRSTRTSRRYTSCSVGSSPVGPLTSGDRVPQQKQPVRPNQAVNNQKSPVHSSNSSVSATFTPRLPSQPQFYGANDMGSHPPSFRRSRSARSILTMLTAEEYRQLNNASTESAGASTPPQPQPQPQSQPQSQPEPPCQHQQQPDLSSAHSHHSQPQQTHPLPQAVAAQQGASQVVGSTLSERTPVPRALLPAYWEITRTFILPNATLELNLDEDHVDDIKRLFKNNECYLEMYEPIVQEVQELVYSNVWPRFVQSIQRPPQGFSVKFLKTWHGLFGGGSRTGDIGNEEVYMGHSTASTSKGLGGGGWRHTNNKQKHCGRSTSRDRLQQQSESIMMERGFSKTMSSVSPSPSPPQASYNHSQYGILGGGRRGNGSNRGCEKEEDTDVDVGQFGVMQDLDFTVLQRIIVDPK